VLDDHDQRLAFLDDVSGELGRVAAADVSAPRERPRRETTGPTHFEDRCEVLVGEDDRLCRQAAVRPLAVPALPQHRLPADAEQVGDLLRGVDRRRAVPIAGGS
jgi:hypothetical protein